MNLINTLQASFKHHLLQHFCQNSESLTGCSLILNTDENKQAFGDLNSNAAMVLAKQRGANPRQVAQQIVDAFSHSAIARIEIAGPGFLNLFLTSQARSTLAEQLAAGQISFFHTPPEQIRSVSIEFVSANPTGPLHFGHGRGGIIGDVLGNVLTFLGHRVTKEFYINDAGSQIAKLGLSFKIRCQQALGIDIALPEDAYHGDYLAALAQQYVQEHGARALEHTDAQLAHHAKELLLKAIKKTLDFYGINYHVWFSEKTLHESDAIDRALAQLAQHGFLYQKEDATWFASTHFGDDKDRVVRKANGELTYVAADIAYLQDKIARGSSEIVMVLGADHHSYAVRLEAVLKALGLHTNNNLHVILYQLVKIKEDGQLMRMSKRAGTMVTLDDVIEAVGTDVARFFYLNRKADAQLEFDLALAARKTEENPVYYIQYAYVRTASISAKAAEHDALTHIKPHDIGLLNDDEMLLIKKIVALGPLLQDIGTNFQTHLLAYYTHDLAQTFSRFYSKNRVIDLENVPVSRSRLVLVGSVRCALELCLDLMGLSKPERM